MNRKNKDWITRVIDDIKVNSKLVNNNQTAKNNRIEDDRFMNECRYQYIQKHEQERDAFKNVKAKGVQEILNQNPRSKSSAVYLMLYKKMLTQLAKDNSKHCDDHYRILDVEREISRTEGLNVDESLTNFAKQNRDVMKALILMECEDF